MIKVYIAGPYTNGDVAVNVRNAFEIGNILSEKGFAPFIPHYTHFWHMMYPKPYEYWLKLDKEFLKCCDCLFRIRGQSNGADEEEKMAAESGIPIFHDLDDLYEYYKGKERV